MNMCTYFGNTRERKTAPSSGSSSLSGSEKWERCGHNGTTGSSGCTDINECSTNNGGCDGLTTCTNTPGSNSCGGLGTGATLSFASMYLGGEERWRGQ